mgnify:CR=1 FL=1
MEGILKVCDVKLTYNTKVKSSERPVIVLQIQLRSATSQCVLHEKTTAGLPQRQGCIAPESVESISNTIKKETEVSLGLTIFVLL